MDNSKQDRKLFYKLMNEGKKIMEIPFQACPICHGTGQLLNTGAVSSMFRVCDVCGGRKVILMGHTEIKPVEPTPAPDSSQPTGNHENSSQLTLPQIEAVLQWLDQFSYGVNIKYLKGKFKEDFTKHLKEPVKYDKMDVFNNSMPVEDRPVGTPTPIKLSYGGKEISVSFEDFNTKSKIEDILNQFVFIKYEPTPAQPPYKNGQVNQVAPPYVFTHGQRFKAKYKGEEVEGKIFINEKGIWLDRSTGGKGLYLSNGITNFESPYWSDLTLYPLEK